MSCFSLAWIMQLCIYIALISSCTKARADTPKLPVGVTCEIVRAKVAEHGKIVAYAWATLQGYSRREIKEARKCLK